MADIGVPVEAEPNRRLLALAIPASNFSSRHLNSVPTTEEADEVLPALRALYDELKTAHDDGAHPQQTDQAWGHLAEACERIAKTEGLSCKEAVGRFVKDVLLEASLHSKPVPNPELDAQFDQSPSWGGPSARLSAAAGLTLIARSPTCADESTLGAIEYLGSDLVPAVRFQVATQLLALYDTAPELMWRMLERMCREEPSKGVLVGLLSAPVSRLVGYHPKRVIGLVRQVFARTVDGVGADKVREICIHIFAGLYLWQNNPECEEVVFQVADRPDQFFVEVQQMLLNLRECLALGSVVPPEPDKDEIRKRAVSLMVRSLDATRIEIRESERSLRENSLADGHEPLKEKAQHLVRVVDSACHQVYFASGAFDEKSASQGTPKRLEEKRRFLKEAKPILDILGSFAFPAVVHNLLETLEFLLDADPREVFLLIANVVRAGKSGGYQYEPMAVNLIVGLVERYLAEYRHILREDRECRQAMIEILDTFVQAGWPAARRLTYRLDEIFR